MPEKQSFEHGAVELIGEMADQIEKLRAENAELRQRRVQTSAALSAAYGNPIPMILFCPAPGCGLQHIDAEAEHDEDCATLRSWRGPDIPACDCDRWMNPPHRTHTCHSCGHMWRPADIATAGVAEIETKGKHDSDPIRGRIPVPATMETLWRHKVRQSVYTEVGRGELQMSTPHDLKEGDIIAVYRDRVDGKLYLRPEAEFDDGRFERIDYYEQA